MTQLIPAVMRYNEVSARFESRVLKEALGSKRAVNEFLYECFMSLICWANYDDMQRTIFELILNNKEVVQ